MLRRFRTSCAVILAAAFAASVAPPAAAAPSRHVFILWLDGSTLSDWTAPALPNFHRLLGRAALGLLGTRTANESTDPSAARLNAAITFGAAAPAAGRANRSEPLHVAGATPGLLGDALKAADLKPWVIGDADGEDIQDRSPLEALVRTNGALPTSDPTAVAQSDFPGGSISSVSMIQKTLKFALLGASIILVDPGDTERLQRINVKSPQLAASAKPLAMQHADAVLGIIQTEMKLSDLLMVVSASASVARQREGIRLSAVAIEGPGFVPGLLTSGTTRRDGVVTLPDLAPTIVEALGLPPLAGADGRPATVKPTTNAVPTLLALERDVIRASLDRRPLTRWTLVAAMLLVVVALAVVWFAGRARGKRTRLPSGARDWLATLLVAAAATPLALYVNGAFHPSSTSVAGLETVAVALGLALGARVVAGLSGALIAVLGLTALVPLVDLLIGTPLGVRSPLAFQIAGGGRFYGVDDGVLGVVVGAEIFVAALLLERARDLRRTGRWVALFFAASVWLLGAPAYGSKFGAALTAIPALGVFAVLVAGKRLTLRVSAAIGAVTLAVTGLLIAVDALRSSASQSHVARAVEGRSSVTAILSKKISAQWQITAHTIWTPAILVFAAAILLILWGRRDQVASLSEWHVLLKAALFAALVGGVAGLVFNDGGVITAAPIALFAATAFFAMLLDRPSPESISPD